MFPCNVPLFILITYLLSVQSVPIEPSNNNETTSNTNESYDVSQFDEVYDQRQNGSENYRVSVNKVVLVWTPPGSLFTAAALLDPSLFDSDYSDLEEFIKPQKPDELIVIKPEETTKTPDITTESSTTQSTEASSRRRLRLPGFIRPFIRRPLN